MGDAEERELRKHGRNTMRVRGTTIQTNRAFKVVVPSIVHLVVRLFDQTGTQALANQAYQIKGPQSFEGTTDAQGRFEHLSVTRGAYTVSVPHAGSGQTHTVGVPWTMDKSVPHLQHVRGYQSLPL